MSNPTENPIPSQQDDIKSVLQDVLFQQVQTLLNFTRKDGFALQIPETDTLILAGRAGKISEFLGAGRCDMTDEQIWKVMFENLPSHAVSMKFAVEAGRALLAASIASQSQAAQPTEAVEQIMTLAHSWAMAAYKKALNLPFEDIDAIRKQLRDAAAHIAGTSQAPQSAADLADDDRYQHVRDILLDAMGAADVVNKSRLNMALDLLSDIAVAPKCAARTSQATKAQAEPSELRDDLQQTVSDFRKATYEFARGQDPEDHAAMMAAQKRIFDIADQLAAAPVASVAKEATRDAQPQQQANVLPPSAAPAGQHSADARDAAHYLPPVAPKGPFADYSAEEVEAYAREYSESRRK